MTRSCEGSYRVWPAGQSSDPCPQPCLVWPQLTCQALAHSIQPSQELASDASLRAAYDAGASRLQHLSTLLSSPPPPLSSGSVGLSLAQRPSSPGQSNMTKVGLVHPVLLNGKLRNALHDD